MGNEGKKKLSVVAQEILVPAQSPNFPVPDLDLTLWSLDYGLGLGAWTRLVNCVVMFLCYGGFAVVSSSGH